MYNFREIEKKWSCYWDEHKVFRTTENKLKKFYVLDMFPYPSGSGLHVGHPKGYTATDIVARYKRLNGFDVLHPIGWDAFGLPAEQYAFKTGNHPSEFTQQNIINFRRQLKSFGFSFDYEKEVNTTDPKYYKWTQWIFARMYEKGLAYLKDIDVNWCEELGTVLANEEVLIDASGNSVSERGNFPVIKRKLKQWVLKITDYADRLIDDLSQVDWPHSIINLQKNWIGREEHNGKKTFHLQDWVFSRQRYWGEPFPLMYSENNEVFLIDNLPVKLPLNKDISIKPSGNGESPLSNFKDWLKVEKDGKTFRRETHTMPQWAGSSWYFLAYIMKNPDGSYLPLNSKKAKEKFKKWMPIDLYIGGQEHATLHLIYARFWYKVLYDLKIVPTSEPFFKIINQGMILGEDGTKMSKSVGNVINPDEIILSYGADTLRVYEMFMGPLIETNNWSTKSLSGIFKWLNRVYNFFIKALDNKYNDLLVINTIGSISRTHKIVKEITDSIENLTFNIGISKLMVYINDCYKDKSISKDGLEKFAIILSPFAPFLAEELYQLVQSKNKDLSLASWPTYNQKCIVEESATIAIQINGKTKSLLSINPNATQDEIIKLALGIPSIIKYLANQQEIKRIYVPGKIVNFIVK